jgi:hypothetical protein
MFGGIPANHAQSNELLERVSHVQHTYGRRHMWRQQREADVQRRRLQQPVLQRGRLLRHHERPLRVGMVSSLILPSRAFSGS